MSFTLAFQLVGFSRRICCSSDVFLRSGGYWEELAPLGYEDWSSYMYDATEGRELHSCRLIQLDLKIEIRRVFQE